ncbi:MAG: gamma-glutamyl kinase [Roseovarius sp.]|jgi:hypothetical protein|nr:gamma-glutamyl kinase [Roseovarius sp.]
MLVIPTARLVFLSVPKTGTSAYQAALATHAAIVVTDPPELKHAPVFRYNRFFRPMVEKFFTEKMDLLAVMREPVSWLGSWYRYRRRPFMQGRANATHDVTFDEFVTAYTQGQRPAFANVGSQAKFLEPQRNGTAVTHLFRYEDQTGLKKFLEERLQTTVETPIRNASPEMPLTLSPETEGRLRRKSEREFRLWESIGDGGAYTPLQDKV